MAVLHEITMLTYASMSSQDVVFPTRRYIRRPSAPMHSRREVGPNGAGKSCFIRALDLFYAALPSFNREDFYNHDISEDIEIAVTFKALH